MSLTKRLRAPLGMGPLFLFLIGSIASFLLSAEESPGQQAKSALVAGKYQRAEELYRRLSEQNPQSAEAFNNLGFALHLQGKSSEAIVALTQALRINELPGTVALLGANYCRLREYDRARPLLQSALR